MENMAFLSALIGLLSGAAGLFLLFHKPLTSVSLAIQECTLGIKDLCRVMNEFKQEYRKEVGELWEHQDEQDKKITAHDVRISVIEERMKNDGRERETGN